MLHSGSPTYVHPFLSSPLFCYMLLYCTYSTYKWVCIHWMHMWGSPVYTLHATQIGNKVMHIHYTCKTYESYLLYSLIINPPFTHIAIYAYTYCMHTHVEKCETFTFLQQHSIPLPRITSSVVSPLLIGNLPPVLTCYWLVYCVASRQHFTIAIIRARWGLLCSQLHIRFNSLSNFAQTECSTTHPPTAFLQFNTPTYKMYFISHEGWYLKNCIQPAVFFFDCILCALHHLTKSKTFIFLFKCKNELFLIWRILCSLDCTAWGSNRFTFTFKPPFSHITKTIYFK